MNPVTILAGLAVGTLLAAGPARSDIPADQPGLLKREFIYETAPFPECHASTIVETGRGLMCAWFGGLEEKDPSVGIWTARLDGSAWSAPVEVATGVQADGTRLPCWNPVLWQEPDGPLLLFYKVGPTPSTWWGMLKRSGDSGETWGEAVRLPDGILGPVKNKPVRLPDGTLLCPSSSESNDAADAWRVHFELTRDLGATWTRIIPPAAAAGATPIDAIQPSVLLHRGPDGNPGSLLQALGRSRSGRIFETWSRDAGRTWSPVALTTVPNPSSGTDAVTLRSGQHLLVYNPVPKGRSPLAVAVSTDGKAWKDVLVLENDPGEYSYPAIMEASDGTVHITYTWKRQRLRHVAVNPSALR